MVEPLPPQPDDPNSFVRPNAPTPVQMPGVAPSGLPPAPVYTNPEPLKPPKEYTIGEQAQALWRENDFYIMGKVAYDQIYGQPIDHTPDPNFDPVKEAEGTWAQHNISQLIGLRNRAEFDDYMRRGNEHIENDKVLAAGGNMMLAARFANGLISPAMAIPAFVGPRVFGTTARLAAGGLASGVALEPFYRAENPLRSNSDSALALGASTIGAVALGKLLGFTPPEQREVLTRRIQEVRGEAPFTATLEGRAAIVDAYEMPGAVKLTDNDFGPDAPAVPANYRPYTPEELDAAIAEMPQSPNLLIENMYQAAKNGEITPEDIAKQAQYEAAFNEWHEKHKNNLGEIYEKKMGEAFPFDGEVRVADDLADDMEFVDRPRAMPREGQSVSAASSDNRSLEQMQITPPILRPVRDAIGNVVQGIAKLPGGGYAADLVTTVGRMANAIGVSPVGDILERSKSRTARSLILDLAETTRHITDERLGNTKANDGGAIETFRKTETDLMTYRTLDGYESAYAKYAFGSVENAPIRMMGSGWWGMTTPQDKISYEEFSQRVFMALNYSDRDIIGEASGAIIPEVQEAAGAFRQLFDHWQERAKAAKFSDGTSMMGDNMGPPLGAETFAPNIYDRNKIAANWDGFVGMFYDALKADQNVKAAAQSRIASVYDDFNRFNKSLGNIDARIAKIDERINELSTRLDERAIETRAAKKAEGRAQDRVQTAEELMKAVQDDIDFLRGELSDPESNLGLKALEEEMRMLREEAKPIPARELDKMEKAEVARQFADPDLRRAVEIAIGKRKRPEAPNFAGWIMSEGGIVDVGGNIRAKLENRVPPGFYRKDRNLFSDKPARAPDDWGEYFQQMAPEEFPERPTEAEVIDIINDAVMGNPPEWWVRQFVDQDELRVADAYREFFEEAGRVPKTIREAARVLSSDFDDALLKRLQNKVEAGRDLEGITEDIEGRKAAREAAREQITQLIRDRRVTKEKLSGAKVAEGEVKSAGARNRGRVGMLADRQENLEQIRAILELTKQSFREQADSAWTKLEGELERWQGNSSEEFKRLLKERREMERASATKAAMGRGAERAARYTIADDAAERAIRAIIDSDRNLSDQELSAFAEEIASNIKGDPAGRLPYDGDGITRPPITRSNDYGTRGSLRAREVPIDLMKKSEFLVDDMREVMSVYLRTMAPDVQLVERFGTLDFDDFKKAIREDYNAERNALSEDLKAGRISRKEYDRKFAALDYQQDRDLGNTIAVVERLRNTYGYSPDLLSSGVAAFARDLSNLVSVSSLGRSVINSLNDAGGNAALRYGFGYVVKDQWAPLVRSLASLNFAADNKELLRQAREFSIGLETASTLMNANLDALSNIRPGNRFSKTLAYGASRFQIASGLVVWTDNVKAAAMIPAMRSMADAAGRLKAGKATEQDLIKLADASIPQNVAVRIAEQWEAHSTPFRGTLLPNLDKWTDPEAVRIVRAAMRREVDAVVPTSGIGSSPIWTASIFGRLIGQFKGYMFAAHEKMYLANAQNFQFRMVSNMLTSVALGTASYYLYIKSKGDEPSYDPAVVLKEASDRSGFMALYNEINKITSKATGGNIDVWRITGAKKPLTRRADNSALSEMLGPGYGYIEKGFDAGRHFAAGAASWAEGKSFQDHFTGADASNLRRMIPGNNMYFPISMGFDWGEDTLVRLGHLKPTPAQRRRMSQ